MKKEIITVGHKQSISMELKRISKVEEEFKKEELLLKLHTK